MKITLLFTSIFLLLTGLLKAQQDTIYNSSFEKWDTLVKYSNPKHWYSLNALTQVGFSPTTEQTIDSHSGNYAVKLETKSGPQKDLSGLLTTGEILDNNFHVDMNKAKYAFKTRPESISFYYKSMPANSDSSAMIMVLTKWDSIGMKSDTIAKAGVRIGTTINTYTLMAINFTYYSSAIPDSALIVFSSSYNGFSPIVGSVFYIDDVKLNYIKTGFNEIVGQKNEFFFPNPAREFIYIHTENTISIKMYDELGKYIIGRELTKENDSINVSEFKQGIYFLQITDERKQTYFQHILIK